MTENVLVSGTGEGYDVTADEAAREATFERILWFLRKVEWPVEGQELAEAYARAAFDQAWATAEEWTKRRMAREAEIGEGSARRKLAEAHLFIRGICQGTCSCWREKARAWLMEREERKS